MKKKNLSIILAIFIVVPCIFLLTACGGGNDNGSGGNGNGGGGNPAQHTHSYTCQVTTDEFLASAATCTEKASYYWSCSCGGKGIGTFESGEPLGHIAGSANCQQIVSCSRCGWILAARGEHVYGSEVVISEPTCTRSGQVRKTCTICGDQSTVFTPALGHKGDWYVTAKPRCFDTGSEQRICTVCTQIENRELPAIGHHELQAATCTEGKKCKNCHYVEGTGTGHSFSDNWTIKDGCEPTCTKSGVEERKCADCDIIEERPVSALGHKGDWKNTKYASCTTTGTEIRTCTVCGTVFGSREIPAKGHSGDWTTITEATCSQTGKAERKCSVCGDYEEMNLPKAMHTYSDWTVDKEADCSVNSNGTKHRTCTVCGYNDSATIIAVHNYSDSWTVETAATCATSGRRYKTCLSCGNKKYETISKTGHKGEWITTSLASCTEEGSRERTCTVCGDHITEAINKLGHNLVEVTYPDRSQRRCITRKTCSRCGYNEDTTVNNHTYGDAVLIEDPDCEREGLEILTCSVCGYEYHQKISSLRHRFDYSLGNNGWVEIIAPTCLKDGKKRQTCTVCNKAFDERISATGHQFNNWTTKEATCTVDGLRHHECTQCEMSEQQILPATGHDFGILSGNCYGIDGIKCSKCRTHIQKHVYGENGCTVCGLEYTDLEYVLSEDGTYYIAQKINFDSLTSDITTVFIRKTYNGKPVKEIGTIFETDYHTSNESKIQRVKYFVFPEGVETINSLSDYKLTYVEGIILPDSVKRIGDYAFSEFLWLENINAPQNLISVGLDIFGNSNSIWLQAQNDGILYFGNFVYGYKGTMPENGILTVKEGTIGIAPRAFMNKSSLKGLILPDELYIIGDAAFLYSGIESFTIKSNMIIGENIFGYSGLKELIIEDGVTKLGGFRGCEDLVALDIPDSVEEISEEAFTNCSSLKFLKLGSGLRIIGKNAFSYCGAIETLTIPKNVQTIGDYAFYKSEIKNLILEDGVGAIGMCAFYNCANLKTIVMNSVDSVAISAFENCTALTDLVINGCNLNSNLTFKGCTALENITFKGNISSIYGNEIFSECSSVKKVYIFAEAKNAIAFGDFDNDLNIEVTFEGTKDEWYELYIDRYQSNWAKEFYFVRCTIKCSDGIFNESYWDKFNG